MLRALATEELPHLCHVHSPEASPSVQSTLGEGAVEGEF